MFVNIQQIQLFTGNQGCGSGTVLGIWIWIQGQENEEISVDKCTF
jgi:hypothetical protein